MVTPGPERASLFAELSFWASDAPDRPALIVPDQPSVSFGQLWLALGDVRALLQTSGIPAEAVVAVAVPDAACGLIGLLGAASYCVCAPMNPDLVESEFESGLKELKATALIVSSGDGKLTATAHKLGLLLIQASRDEHRFNWQVCSPARHASRSSPELPPGTGILLQTSATTGRRKIVPLTHGNLHAMVENSRTSLRLTPHDRLLLMARLFHIQGLLSAWAQLRAGGAVILPPEYSPAGFERWMSVEAPTWYAGGPTLHRTILQNLATFPLAQPGSLRFVRSGGTLLPPELRSALESALKVPVLDVYGLTEVGAVASTPLTAAPHESPLGEGHVIGPTVGPEIAILGEDGTFVPSGTEGQIVVRGPNVMPGYLDDVDANRDAFHDGWFLTGDLGRLDAQARLHVTGRIKEIINRGGQKVIPDEVDAALASHPAIREIAAFSVKHPSLGEEVACAVVLREGFHLEREEFRAYAAGKLSHYKIPRSIHVVEAIPRGATGKPQRLALSDRFSKSTASISPAAEEPLSQTKRSQPGHAVPPVKQDHKHTPIDLTESLADLWRNLLGLETVGVDDDFFALGGDSLSATAMLGRVASLLNLQGKLPSSEFFRLPTLRNLSAVAATAMAGQVEDPASSRIVMIPVKPGPAEVAFFMVPSDGAEGCCFRQMARHMKPQWSLHLLRPRNTWHAQSRTSIQDAAEDCAALIMQEQSAPVCVLGGYCYGSVVAFEAARILERKGRQCLLMLLDAPTPGYPHLLWDPLPIARAARKQVKLSLRRRSARPFLGLGKRLLRRAAWLGIRRLGPRQSAWGRQPLAWLERQSRVKYLSFIRPEPIGVPVIHFLATGQTDYLHEESRLGWPRYIKLGLETCILPCAHEDLLEQPTLPVLMERLSAWLAATLVQEKIAR
jgi:acyl-CoA synthetase (AMP-forming)/AMP-acid ligase II/thioesterase domain-containing protein